MTETPDEQNISPYTVEIANITDAWIRELGAALEAKGIIVTDGVLLVHAIHAIAHVCGGIPHPDIVAAAVGEAAWWYEGCMSDWFDGQFTAMLEHGAFAPHTAP